MRKNKYVVVTACIMLVISRMMIRIVDATVQIDDDISMLILMLIIINLGVAFVSYRFYAKKQ